METVFWVSGLFVAYVYAGYPLLLVLWVAMKDREAIDAAATKPLPTISVVIAARNEAARLPRRIGNLLALDYPRALLQIIVVSDGSTDGTVDALSAFGDSVELIAAPFGGKAAALNAGVARARHDIVVFADARQTFSADALSELAARFADPHIGGVTGELVLGCESAAGRRSGADRRTDQKPDTSDAPGNRRASERRDHLTSTIADGIGLYWRYEKSLRRLESAAASTIGATGAIYAVRRTLWRPLPEGTILDDVLTPMRVVLGGHRVVFEERAQAFDHTSHDSAVERRRKVRTLAGNFQILWEEPRLLIPVVNPVWFQYMSHKVGRLFVPYALMALLATSIALAPLRMFYAAALAGQCLFYLLGGYGAWLEFSETANA